MCRRGRRSLPCVLPSLSLRFTSLPIRCSPLPQYPTPRVASDCEQCCQLECTNETRHGSVCGCVRSSVTLDVILYRLKRQTLASRLARLTRTDVRRTEPARQLSCRPAPVIRGSLIDSLTLQTTTGAGRGEGCRIKLTYCDREVSFPIASTVVVGLYGYRLLSVVPR